MFKNNRILVGALLACAVLALTAFAPDAYAGPGFMGDPGGLFQHFAMASAGLGAVAPEEIKKSIDGMMSAFDEFKKTNDERLAAIEKKGHADPLVTEKLTRIESSMSNYEALNQKLTLAEQESKAAKDRDEELKGKLEKIEIRLGRPRTGGNQEFVDLKQTHNDWARGVVSSIVHGGESRLTDAQKKAMSAVHEEAKALSITNDTTGGYLAPGQYVNEIIKGVTEMSPVRSIVRVRQTTSKSMMIPKRTGQFAAVWVSEQGTRSETDGLRWGMQEIPTHEMYALIDISHQNLEDSAFDLEAEIRMEAMEQFAVAEGTAVVSGNGVGRPEGWLSNSGVSSTVSGSAATIPDSDGQANGLMTLFHELPTPYTRNALWTLNRLTLGSVRKLKDAEKNYIWMPGLANGIPNTILGAPYVETPDMPNEGANAYPIAFGDFRRGYTMVDRIAMSMLRDPFTQAGSGNIRFLFYRRIGGQVVLPEAIRLLKCST